MKTQRFLILIVLLIGMTNCKKNENVDIANGINFCTDEKGSDIIVNYDEIIGYDSTKYAFILEEQAWERIAKEVEPAYPASEFILFITLNNELIYKIAFIPLYYSILHFDIITFKVEKPNMVFVQLGYPPEVPGRMFTGEDLRNDLRLIEQLKKDNKLIEIED